MPRAQLRSAGRTLGLPQHGAANTLLHAIRTKINSHTFSPFSLLKGNIGEAPFRACTMNAYTRLLALPVVANVSNYVRAAAPPSHFALSFVHRWIRPP